jgi:predicted PurR-regulated permease PerM
MISSAVRVPFLLVMFGVFGGIAAFGLIGLFLGPIILAVALAAWNEWVRSVGAMSDSAGQ